MLMCVSLGFFYRFFDFLANFEVVSMRISFLMQAYAIDDNVSERTRKLSGLLMTVSSPGACMWRAPLGIGHDALAWVYVPIISTF